MKLLVVGLRRALRGAVCCLALLVSGPTTVAHSVLDGEPQARRFVRGEGEIEEVLDRIMGDIQLGHNERALLRSEALIEERPNFLLGHLLRGDLLRLQAGGISMMGDAPRGPPERLLALREEARARLTAWRNPPPPHALPRVLVQMGEHQDFAVLVDTELSRLYVFGNEGGRPRLVEHFYISQGKAGADKAFAGDKRTPLGVYRITEKLPHSALGSFYGSGAFALNYPNEWDKHQGRSGHGIWLHGTPPDTYSRAPRASEGCVVLANDDLRRLDAMLQPGHTPVVISPNVQWVSERDWHAEREALSREIEMWRRAREQHDATRLLGLYSPRMHRNPRRHEAWLREQRDALAHAAPGAVRVSDLTVLRDPKDDLFVATFELDEKGQRSRVRQYWLREAGQWKIVFET